MFTKTNSIQYKLTSLEVKNTQFTKITRSLYKDCKINCLASREITNVTKSDEKVEREYQEGKQRRDFSMRNTKNTAFSSLGTEETKIRSRPRVKGSASKQEDDGGRAKRVRKIRKIENRHRSATRQRKDGENEEEEQDKGNTWKVERAEDPSIYQKRGAHEDIERLFLWRRESDSSNERRGRGGRGSRSAEG